MNPLQALISKTYVLDEDKKPRKCQNLEEYQTAMDIKKRRVEVTKLGENLFTVSTVFLALDHNFGEGDKPVFFETFIWSNLDKEKQVEPYYLNEVHQRYTTWDDAVKGHAETVEGLKKTYAKFLKDA